MKESYSKLVRVRMEKKQPSELLFGSFRGRSCPHIFKELKDNFIDGSYPRQKCCKGSLTTASIKYHYAEHLNSSQAMCIGYFKKFFESEAYESLLIDVLARQGIDVKDCGKCTDAVFEHIPDAAEGTNFDFYIKFENGAQLTWEIKYTESEFGGTTKQKGHESRYIDKYKSIYVPMLQNCAYDRPEDDMCRSYACLATGTLTDDCDRRTTCAVYEFYRYYQIRRNILYAKNAEDYVLFLTPRENESLAEGRTYIERYANKWQTDHIRNVYWEDLLQATLSAVAHVPELLQYYAKFQEKYFG
ncbi:MAG: hypothetical protein IKM08_08915 [Clostridia bacterium]|nr:hypothetical protein [Clostridia bacterium]